MALERMPKVADTGPLKRRIYLHEQIDDAFNEIELKDLCFRLDVDYESLAGVGKADHVRELVMMLVVRHGRKAELIQMCQTLRPKLNWNNL